MCTNNILILAPKLGLRLISTRQSQRFNCFGVYAKERVQDYPQHQSSYCCEH